MTRLRPLSLAAALLTLALATGCASRALGPAVPQPFPTPGGSARTPTAPGNSSPDVTAPPNGATAAPTFVAQTVIDTAMRLLGTRYRNGGADPDGFDCSGFVYYVFAQAGVSVPRTVNAQAHAGEEVRAPQPGDLVFFHTTGRGATHVGIALGPDRFIHAPSSRGEVRIEPLARPYWSQRYLEARRLF